MKVLHKLLIKRIRFLKRENVNAENEIIKAKVAKLSSERVIQEDEGFLEKLLGFFNKDKK